MSWANGVMRPEMADAEVLLYPEFFPADEGGRLFAALSASLPWERRPIRMFGREVIQPRLVAWMGDPGVGYRYSGLGLTADGWTPELEVIRNRIGEVVEERFNSVLCNLYRDGGDSMGWHSDDEKELGAEPVIGSVSFGAARRFQFRRRDDRREAVGLKLRHGSLLVMRGKTQQFWHHQVPKTGKKEVGRRINLTFRRIF